MVKGSLDAEALADDRHEDINRDRDPDLGLHGVLAGAEEGLDPQVLLDPFEEQLDLPAAFVDLGDGKRGQREVIGQELESLAGLLIQECHAPKRFGIDLRRAEGRQDDRVIGAQAGGLVYLARVAALQKNVGLGPHYKEGGTQSELIETLEIDIPTIHDVAGSGFGKDVVKDLDVVHFSIGNANKSGDIAVQVQQSVHLDGGLVLAELGPRKDRQTQIDRRGIERIKAVVQLEADRVGGVHRSRDCDESQGKITIDAPVVPLVGIGQRRSRNLAPKAHVEQLAGHGSKTRLDVAQTLPVSQLRKCHGQILIPAGKPAWVSIAAIPRDTFPKFLNWRMSDHLRENSPTRVHASLFRTSKSGFDPGGKLLEFQIDFKTNHRRSLILGGFYAVAGK